MIDQSCLAAKLALLDKEANSDCTDAEKCGNTGENYNHIKVN